MICDGKRREGEKSEVGRGVWSEVGGGGWSEVTGTLIGTVLNHFIPKVNGFHGGVFNYRNTATLLGYGDRKSAKLVPMKCGKYNQLNWNWQLATNRSY